MSPPPVRFPVCLLLAVGLGVACTPFRVVTPAGLVELPDQAPAYDYRATSPDGLVLAVRAIDHEPRGDLAFWEKTIERRLRLQGGYALLETRSVKAKSGLSGRQLRFGHDEGASPHLYLLTLFVDDDHIFLVEAGGPKELVEQEASKIDAFVERFEVR